jgi:hypothetical protein
MSEDPEVTIQLSYNMPHGLACPVDYRSLPFVSRLNLADGQIIPFLVFAGYFLGDGWLVMNAIMFSPAKGIDVVFLHALLRHLGAEYSHQQQKENDRPDRTRFTVYDSKFFLFFKEEYGRKYSFSPEFRGKTDTSTGETAKFSSLRKSPVDQPLSLALVREADIALSQLKKTKDESVPEVEETPSSKWFWPWVWKLDRQCSRALLRGIRFADGDQADIFHTPNGDRLSTSSRRFRNEYVRLIHQAGYSSVMNVGHDEGSTSTYKDIAITAGTTAWHVRYTEGQAIVLGARFNSANTICHTLDDPVWGFNFPGQVLVRLPLSFEAGETAMASRPILFGKPL